MRVKCIVEQRAYEFEEKELSGLLSFIRNNFIKKKTHAIYAVRKGSIIDLKNEEYTSIVKAREGAKKYRTQGFKVFLV